MAFVFELARAEAMPMVQLEDRLAIGSNRQIATL
jgi:hypothetical protein